MLSKSPRSRILLAITLLPLIRDLVTPSGDPTQKSLRWLSNERNATNADKSSKISDVVLRKYIVPSRPIM